MNIRCKKALALLLAVIMTVSLFPLSAFAEGEEALTAEEPAAEEPVVETVPEEPFIVSEPEAPDQPVSAEPDPEPEAETPAEPEPTVNEEADPEETPAEPDPEDIPAGEPAAEEVPEVTAEPEAETAGPLWEQVFVLESAAVGVDYGAELPGTEGEVSAALLADEAVTGLPAGLALTRKTAQDPADNVYVLSGVPAAAGRFSFLLTVSDPWESRIYRYELTVAAPAAAPAEPDPAEVPAEPAVAEEPAAEETAEEPLQSDALAESLLSLNAKAPRASGPCGDGLTWSLSTAGVLTVSGSGDMPDLAGGSAPWRAYQNDIVSVVLAEGITSIGEGAFQYYSQSLKSVSAPSVTAIGDNAFQDCTSLSSADFPLLSTVGQNTFDSCSSLSLSLPASLTAVGNHAFDGIGSLRYAGTLSAWMRLVMGKEGADGWTVTCSDGVLKTFGPCGTNLNWVLSTAGLLTVSGSGEMADVNNGSQPWFIYRTDIVSVVLSEGVTSIGSCAFQECFNLESVTAPDVTSIDSHAFQNCHKLNSVSAPSVAAIGEYAFINCSSMNLSLPASLTAVGNHAFDGIGPLRYAGTMSDWVKLVAGIKNADFWRVTCSDGMPRASGPCGDSLNWVLSTAGLLTVSGSGEMDDFSGEPAPWQAYQNDIVSVVLAEGVTSIGSSAFQYCYNLESISAPSVTAIGNNAFHGCNSLSSAEFPLLSTVGEDAFSYCSCLNLSLPASLTAVENHAFDGVASLTYAGTMSDWVRLVAGVDGAGGWTVTCSDGTPLFFGPCGTNLNWVLSTEGVLTVSGSGAMSDVDNGSQPWYDYRNVIVDLVLAEGITSIGSCAFQGYYSLNSVSAPSVTAIGEFAFQYCNNLKSVSAPSVTAIGNNAFQDCNSLSSAEFPLLSTVGQEAFSNCIGLNLSLPASLTAVGDSAFNSVKSLTYAGTMSAWVRLVVGIEGAGGWTVTCSDGTFGSDGTPRAFGPCGDSLNWVLSTAGVLTVSGSGAMSDVDNGSQPWYDYRNVIVDLVLAEGITSIGSCAFQGCFSLNSVSAPSVTAIGEFAFQGCNSLESVSAPSVTAIGEFAFQYCNNLKSVSAPSVTAIGNNALQDCNSLSSAAFPLLSTVGQEAFSNCTGLNLSLPASLTVICNGAFNSVGSLTYVGTMSDWAALVTGVEGAGGWRVACSDGTPRAFGPCGDSLNWVLSEDGVLTVSGSGAMDDFAEESAPWRAYQDDIVDLVLAEGITSIGSYAFQFFDSLEIVTAPSVTVIDEFAFQGCNNLKSVSAPSVTAIGNSAFENSTSLTTAEFPLLSTVGQDAFSNCISLSLSLPVSLTAVGDCAFRLVTSLTYAGTMVDWVKLVIGVGEADSWRVTCSDGVPKVFGTCGDSLNWVLSSEGVLTVFGSGEMSNFTRSASPWTVYRMAIVDLVLEEGVSSIGSNAFYQCYRLESVTAPSVTTIGNGAFQECTGLSSVSAPSVTVIRAEAFRDCRSLRSLVLSGKLSVVGDNAFKSCSALSQIQFEGIERGWSWDAVSLGSGNDALSGADLSFSVYAQADGVHLTGPASFAEALSIYGNDIDYICDFDRELMLWNGFSLNGTLTAEQLLVPAGVSAYVKTLQVKDLTLSGTLSVDSLVCTGTLTGAENLIANIVSLAVCSGDVLTAAAACAQNSSAAWTLAVSGSITLSQELNLPANCTAILDNLAVLTVNRGTCLTVNGVLELRGGSALRVIGSCVNNGAIVRSAGTVEQCSTGVFSGGGTYTGSGVYSAESFAAAFPGFEPDRVALLTADDTAYSFRYGTETGELLRIVPRGEQVRYRSDVTGSIVPGFYGIAADGNFANGPEDTVSYALYVLASSKAVKQTVTVKARADGEPVSPAKGLYSWSSSNTKLVTVKESADGSAVITVKAKAKGACTVTAKTKDGTGAKTGIAVYIMDYEPRLVTSSVTLDTQKSNSATVGLVTSYGAKVTGVQFLAYNSKTKKYNVEGKLNASYADEQVTLSAPALMKNQTVKGQLLITVEGLDKPVKKTLTVKIKNSVPTVTVTQPEKFNLLSGTGGQLFVSVKGERITFVELEAASFIRTFLPGLEEDGSAELDFVPKDWNDPKPAAAAKLTIELEGYAFPVTKSVKISYVSEKPTARLSVSTLTLNGVFLDREAYTELSLNKGKLVFTEETLLYVELKSAPKGVNKAEAQTKFVFDWDYETGAISAHLNGAVKNGTYKFSLKPSVASDFDTSADVDDIAPATLTVKVNSALPKLTLSDSTLTLSRSVPGRFRAATAVVPEDSGYTVEILEVKSTAKKAAEKAQAAKIEIYFNEGLSDWLTVSMKDTNDLPAAGTYGYKLTARVRGYGGEATLSTTLKVIVEEAPKVILSRSSVSLNRSSLTAGNEVVAIDLSLPEEYEWRSQVYSLTCTDTGSRKTQAQKIQMRVSYDGEHCIRISLDPYDLPAAGTYSFTFTAQWINEVSASVTCDTAPVKFSVKVTEGTPSATVKASGKLDTVNRSGSGITYTLTKLSYAAGTPTAVELIGPDADLFELEPLGSNAKGQPVTVLRLKEGAEYSTARTCRVQLQYTLAQAQEDEHRTVTVKSPVLKVKPVQSKLTLKTSPSATRNYYQSQSRDRVVTYDIALTSPAGAAIESVALGKVSFWQADLQDRAKKIELTYTDTTIHVEITMKDTSIFVGGKTYTLPLVITPKGCATNAAATKLNLKLKLYK